MANITVEAVASADIAHNQKSCRAAGKTFRHIGAGRFLTNGMQLKIGHVVRDFVARWGTLSMMAEVVTLEADGGNFRKYN